MKKLFVIIISLFFLNIALYSQKIDAVSDTDEDSVKVDNVLLRNEFGLNVYPIFGIFGGVRLPNSKMFIQYKYLFDKINLKASLNYSDFLSDKTTYILGVETSTIDNDEQAKDVDSILFRHNYKISYSYDFRVGIEGKIRQSGFDLYAGIGLIGGMHAFNESYQFTKRYISDDDYPTTNFYFDEFRKDGYRSTKYLKLGFDLVFGVSFKINHRCALAVQYAPEFVYLHKTNETKEDTHKYYKSIMDSEFKAIPNFVDVVLNVRF
jgi:hypothetical protein